MEAENSLENLPYEMIRHIIGFLSKIDLVFAQRTCWLLYKCINDVSKNLKFKGHLTDLAFRKWDKFCCLNGSLYYNCMNTITVIEKDGSQKRVNFEIAPDIRFTSVNSIDGERFCTSAYGSKLSIRKISDPFFKEEFGLEDGKSITSVEIKNKKIYACTSYNQVNVWSLEGFPIGEFKTPFCSSELKLSSDGTIIFVYFGKQNRVYAYREDNYKYIAEFHFVKFNPLVKKMKVYGDKLFVLLESGNVTIFEASNYVTVFKKIIKSRNIKDICPVGTNIVFKTLRGFEVYNKDLKPFARLNFKDLVVQDFIVGPSGDLEFLYFSRGDF